jgi:transposase
MCLHPEPAPPVPEMTACVARSAFPKGSIYMRMRDAMGPLFSDDTFVSLFPARGQPALAPWRLALVTIMQDAEGLSDEQAADAVRSRIDWKYALSLELTDPGFDGSVLSEFRTRLLAGNAEELLFTTLLDHFRQRQLLTARGRQRTDSTHVLAAIRTLNRLEEVGEALRHALNTIALAAPGWLRARSPAEWLERYAQRFSEYRLPKNASEREALAITIGIDGFDLLEAIFAADALAWLRQLPAVETLRRIWLQHFYRDEGGIHWRSDQELPPAPIYVSTPYDPDARYGRKRATEWIGYKVHLTETCEADAPHLITHVETTPAPLPDHTATETIHQALQRDDLLPNAHLVDGGYLQGTLLATTAERFGVDLIGPAPPESCWQAREAHAFAPSQFTVAWETQTVTCPHGKTSSSWTDAKDRQRVVRRDSHGKELVRSVAELELGSAYGPTQPVRLIAATDDPQQLKPDATWSMATNLPVAEASPAAVYELYTLRDWIENRQPDHPDSRGWASSSPWRDVFSLDHRTSRRDRRLGTPTLVPLVTQRAPMVAA